MGVFCRGGIGRQIHNKRYLGVLIDADEVTAAAVAAQATGTTEKGVRAWRMTHRSAAT